MTTFSAFVPTVSDVILAVTTKGESIANVQWTNKPTTGHGYAIADFSGMFATRSGADTRFDFAVRCCGFSDVQAGKTFDLVRAAFTDWRPFPSRPDVKATELDGGPILPSTAVPADPRWSSTLLFRIET